MTAEYDLGRPQNRDDPTTAGPIVQECLDRRGDAELSRRGYPLVGGQERIEDRPEQDTVGPVEISEHHAVCPAICAAVRRASAWRVGVGFTPPLVTNRLPSTMYRFGTS